MPDDEKMRQEIVNSIGEDKILLKKGENKLLDILTSSRGFILDDIELIENLKISREISKSVTEKI
jgi:dynein heavy chain